MTTDIRLEEKPFEFEGKTYILRCNMNVLMDVQEQFDGDFTDALKTENSMRSSLLFLAAMMNDFSEDMGWPERFTAKQLGRRLKFYQIKPTEIIDLVIRAIAPPKDAEKSVESNIADPQSEGN